MWIQWSKELKKYLGDQNLDISMCKAGVSC